MYLSRHGNIIKILFVIINGFLNVHNGFFFRSYKFIIMITQMYSYIRLDRYKIYNIKHYSLLAARGLLHRLHLHNMSSDEFQNDRWCENINNATIERNIIIIIMINNNINDYNINIIVYENYGFEQYNNIMLYLLLC